MQINITNVQLFSVGDGDGIRTTVFFKGCNLHCPWCHNPETISKEPVSLCYEQLGQTEVVGRSVSVSELLEELLEDKDYFRESNGGVTFSGGESLLQIDGVLELAKELKKHGVSLTIDTAGNVPYAYFRRLHGYVDTWLFDFKTADDQLYRERIGGSKQLTKENLRNLLRDEKDVRVRIPLIPGINTKPEQIQQIRKDLQEVGAYKVDLLPFHRLGSGKYTAMGLTYAYKDVPLLTDAEISSIKEQLQPFFNVTVE